MWPEYLAYWLRHQRESLIQLAGGTTFRELPKSTLKGFHIPLPPLSEQHQIVGILNRAAKIERLRAQAQERLREFIPALFVKMFGDPATNPMGWEVREFAKVCMRVTVGLVVKPASYYKDKGILALRSLNIREEHIDEEDVKFFSREDTNNKLAKSRIWKDDVVIVRSGQPGTATVIPAHLDGVNAIDILIATPNQAHVVPRYLSGFLNSHAGRRLVLSEERGQIQKHLNVGSLSKSHIPVPLLSLQKQYANIVETALAVQSVTESSGSVAFKLKNSLMSRLLEGGMMDIVDSKRRSAMMARIGGRNTAPELAVRRIAHRMGLRFRVHRKDLPGCPDLVFPKHRLVVFVHGCFWHRHQGCKYAYTPKSRVEFWTEKFESSVARDARQQAALKALGWRVLVIWECETRDAVAVRSRLTAAIHCEEPSPRRKETVSARMGPAMATVGR